MTEWFKVLYDATVASSLSREQMGHCKETRGVLGHSPGEPGTEFCNYSISPRQTETVFSLHDPKSKRIYSLVLRKNMQR